MLTLKQAIKNKRLPEFIVEQESAQLGSVTIVQFDHVVTVAATENQSPNQTLGSRDPGGSTGK